MEVYRKCVDLTLTDLPLFDGKSGGGPGLRFGPHNLEGIFQP